MGDQFIVSAGTFVVNLLLARHLSSADFGVFGVLWGIQITAVTVQTSFIGIPLMVLISKSKSQSDLTTVALALTGLCSGVFLAVLTFAVLVLDRPGLLPAAGLALLGVQFQETLRRALMGRLRFYQAVGGDAMSYLGQALGVGLLSIVWRPTITGTFFIMGISSLIGGVLQLVQVRPSLSRDALSMETLRPFRHLGAPLVVINGIGALAAQSFLWMLAGFVGLAAVGSYQALITVLSPSNPLMLAANSIVTTRAAHIDDSDPIQRERRELAVAQKWGLIIATPLVVYCGFLLIAPGLALDVFFGRSSAYAHLAGDLRILVLLAISQYAYFVVAGVLNARQDTRSLLFAQVGSALLLPIAVPMTVIASLKGTVAASVVSAMVRFAVAFRGLRHNRRPATNDRNV